MLEIFGVSESYKLPDAIMTELLSNCPENILQKIKDNEISDLRDYYQNEQGDRKNLKQDFTPNCICELIGKITLDGECLDMCAGTGALTKVVCKNKIYEQEFSERTIAFNLLDACLNGLEGIIEQADCLRGTVEKRYILKRFGSFSKIIQVDDKPKKTEQKFKNVIMNPPYSMTFPDAKDFRFYDFEVPKSKADYAFVLNGLKHLDEKGQLVAVLPHGVLFRGQKEGKIREWLVKQNLIYAIIGLPNNMFLNTGIPVFLMILRHNSDGVLFIDGSKKCIKNGKLNIMQKQHIVDVVQTFNKRSEIEKFAHLATKAEIQDNNYNLNIPRYVNTFEAEPLPDMEVTLKELNDIEHQIQKCKQELALMLSELTASSAKDRQVIETTKHFLMEEF